MPTPMDLAMYRNVERQGFIQNGEEAKLLKIWAALLLGNFAGFNGGFHTPHQQRGRSIPSKQSQTQALVRAQGRCLQDRG